MTRAGIFGWSYPPGCNSVPGDEPYLRLIKQKKRRAIADYSCENCSQPIKRGTEYWNALHEDEEGQLVTIRSHLICDWERDY